MEERQIEYAAWRTMLLHNLALVVFFVFCAEVILYLLIKGQSLVPAEEGSCLIRYIIMPAVLNAADIVITSCLLKSARVHERLKNDISLSGIALFCFIMAMSHVRFPITGSLFAAPVLISVIYGNRRSTRRITAICLLLAALAIIIAPYDSQIYETAGIISRVLPLAFICGAYLLGSTVLYIMEQDAEELTRIREENSNLKESLRRDAMTGLYNHSEFYRYLEECIRQDIPGICVAVIDIDDFKQVNDIYGHDKGDDILIELADLLMKSCGGSSHISRYGGEEFTVVFTDTTVTKARKTLEAIRSRLETQKISKYGIAIGISAGVAAYQKGQTPQQVFEKCDAAMYAAKRSGKNKVNEL